MIKTAQDIILKPIITEKSIDNLKVGKYTFKVYKNSTKSEIKNAIEKIFDVEVNKITTMNIKGKVKNVSIYGKGRYKSRTSTWKKAIITLTKNSKVIEFFNGIY